MLQRILCRGIYVCGKIRKAFWRVEKAKRHETFEKCKEKSFDCGNKELSSLTIAEPKSSVENTKKIFFFYRFEAVSAE